MNILKTVEECNRDNRACFISYITAGDPSLKDSTKILHVNN